MLGDLLLYDIELLSHHEYVAYWHESFTNRRRVIDFIFGAIVSGNIITTNAAWRCVFMMINE